MIGYVMLGTNDLEKSAAFYDKLCAAFGTPRMMESETFVAWGKPGGGAGLGISKPYNGEAATVGNGVMAAFQAESKEQVDQVYKMAVEELGAQCEGPAGPRGDNFYAGYFRDPDGNKLNVFTMG